MCWHSLYLFKACGHAVVSQQPTAECLHKQVQDQKERTESWSKTTDRQSRPQNTHPVNPASNEAAITAHLSPSQKRTSSKLPQKRPLTPNIDTTSRLPRFPSSTSKPLPATPQAKRSIPVPTHTRSPSQVTAPNRIRTASPAQAAITSQGATPLHTRQISHSSIPLAGSGSSTTRAQSPNMLKSAIPAPGHSQNGTRNRNTPQDQTLIKAKTATEPTTKTRSSTPQSDKVKGKLVKQPSVITTQPLSPKQRSPRKQKMKSPRSATSRATTSMKASTMTKPNARSRGCEKSSQHPYRSYLIHSLCTACQRAQQTRLRQIMNSGMMDGILVDEGRWRHRIEGRRASSTPSTPTRKSVAGGIPGQGNAVDEKLDEEAAAGSRTKAGKGKRTVEELRLVVGLRQGKSVLEKVEALSPKSPSSILK